MAFWGRGVGRGVGRGSGDGEEEKEELRDLPKLGMCRLANVSTCDVTMEVRAIHFFDYFTGGVF